MKKVEKKYVLKKKVKIFISKVAICTIIVLLSLIVIKDNPKIKKYLKENIITKNIKFTKIKSTYEKYFGNILSLDKVVAEEQAVFNEQLDYEKQNTYKDGVVLTVSNNYMVPVIESGIVIFIGEKEDYGNSIIIEQTNGIDTLYGNIDTSSIKLYDYVEKGTLLGESKSNKLYLVFQKDGKYVEYKEYI